MKVLLSILVFVCIYGNAQQPLNLENKLKEDKHDTVTCRTLLELARQDTSVNNELYLKLIKFTESKLKSNPINSTDQTTYRNFLCIALDEISDILIESGDYTAAVNNLHRYYNEMEKLKKSNRMAHSLNRIAKAYELNGSPNVALNYYKKSLFLFQSINDLEGQSATYNNISLVFKKQGDIENALKYVFLSLNIQENLSNKINYAKSLNNVASLFYQQKEIKKALEFSKKSLEIFKQSTDSVAISSAMLNLGVLFYSIKDTNQALKLFEEGLNISRLKKNNKNIGKIMIKLAALYSDKGKNSLAQEYYTSGINLLESSNDKHEMAKSLNNAGNFYLKIKKYKESENYLEKSLLLSKELGYPENIRDVSYNLCCLYKVIGKSKNALNSYELYIKMKDSINNNETQKASIRSQFKYDYEKKATADSIKVAEERKISNLKLKQETTQRYYLYAGLSLVGLFAMFMYNRYRLTKNQKRIIEEQKKTVEEQKLIVDEKQKEILDSINYAQRIQKAHMPTDIYISKYVGKE